MAAGRFAASASAIAVESVSFGGAGRPGSLRSSDALAMASRRGMRVLAGAPHDAGRSVGAVLLLPVQVSVLGVPSLPSLCVRRGRSAAPARPLATARKPADSQAAARESRRLRSGVWTLTLVVGRSAASTASAADRCPRPSSSRSVSASTRSLLPRSPRRSLRQSLASPPTKCSNLATAEQSRPNGCSARLSVPAASPRATAARSLQRRLPERGLRRLLGCVACLAAARYFEMAATERPNPSQCGTRA
jgi:hypothetical protein